MAVDFKKISREESWRVFDDAAQRLCMNIDGGTFARQWDDGIYAGAVDPAVMRVAMLRPGGR